MQGCWDVRGRELAGYGGCASWLAGDGGCAVMQSSFRRRRPEMKKSGGGDDRGLQARATAELG